MDLKENDMKIVSLLTGRGNNSLKDKNVLDVLGYPVLHYPATAVRNSKYIQKNYCSSDDEKILNEAQKEQFEPIVRPAEISGPHSQHIDCIMHGLKEIAKRDEMPDILVITLANNVTLKTEWVDDCIDMMINNMEISAVVPVYVDNDHHPFRAKKMNKDGYLEPFERNMPNKVSTNRQDLEQCVFLAHNIWVLNVKKLIQGNGDGQPPWNFMGDNIKPYYIEESLDIHIARDLLLAQDWILKNI